MMLRPLCRLTADVGAPDEVIAWRGQTPMRLGQLREAVATVARSYADRKAVALICEDSFFFVAGLFGLLHGGVRVVLPSSTQRSVLAPIGACFETVLDDAGVAAAMQTGAGGTLSPLAADATAIDFFTSGSTGAPKKITKTLAMFEREAAILENRFGDGLGAVRVFATVPHQHMFGLPFKLMWALAVGRPFVAETHGLWEPLLADLTAGAVVVSSPAHLTRLAGLSTLPASRRPARIFSAGAPLPLPSSADALAIFGCRPTEIFGSSETGAMATRQQVTGDEPWQTLPGVAVRCDEDGRLSVRTSVVGGDWIEMADLISPTEGGFRYRGRVDSIVKVEGKRVSLVAVEAALKTLAFVETAAVVALQDPLRIAAAVVTTPQGTEVLASVGAFRFGRHLRQALKAVIDPAGLPRQWRFVKTLPLRALGKRSDREIAALFGETQ